ncbi:putative late blight resistance protein R1B-11 [Capsicum chacoense]
MDTIMETKFSQVLLTIHLIEPELRYAYFRSLKLSLPSQLKANIPMVVAIGFLCCFHNDLKEFLSPKAYLMASARDHVCNLCEELNFVIAFLRDPRKMDDGKRSEDLLAHTKTVATKTAHVIVLLLVRSKNEDDASQASSSVFFDLLNETDFIKKEMITGKYLDLWKSIRSNLIPKVNSLGLIDFLLGIINVVLDNKNDSIAFVSHQLEIVKTELLSLRSLLCVNDLKTEITDVVHEAKHAIGSIIIRESPCWHCMLQLSNVIIKIQSVNNKVASHFVSDQIHEIGVGTSAQKSDSSSEVHMPPVKSEIETEATEV